MGRVCGAEKRGVGGEGEVCRDLLIIIIITLRLDFSFAIMGVGRGRELGERGEGRSLEVSVLNE